MLSFIKHYSYLSFSLLLLFCFISFFYFFEIFQSIFLVDGILNNYYQAVISDNFIKNYVLSLIIITFLGFWIPFITKNDRLNSFANYTPSLLPALGLVGTFIGIFEGLVQFDPSNIDKSLPILLSGLKIAFTTSIAGMVGSALVKIISFFHPERVDDSQVGEEDFMEVFRLQKENLIQINEGIKILEKKFEEFASQIGDATVEHLIKALEDVVRDFNKKIEEQFGDNFKIFNDGLKKLIEWQDKYITEVEETKQSINQANNLIQSNKSAISSISKTLEEIPLSLSPAEKILENLNRQNSDLNNSITNIAKFGDDFEKIIPNIENSVNQLSNTLTNEISQVSDRLQTLDKEMTKELEKAIELMGGHLGSLSQHLVNDYKPLVENIRKLIESIGGNK